MSNVKATMASVNNIHKPTEGRGVRQMEYEFELSFSIHLSIHVCVCVYVCMSLGDKFQSFGQ